MHEGLPVRYYWVVKGYGQQTVNIVETPSYAYLPGQNEKHPSVTFDTLRQTAEASLTVDALADCQAFKAGLQFLDQGYFWEAHEMLEPVWMALPLGSHERQFVQGLIQLANGGLKLRMGRAKAAVRSVALARGLVRSSHAGYYTSIPTENRTNIGSDATIMNLGLHEVYRWIDALEDESVEAMSTP